MGVTVVPLLNEDSFKEVSDLWTQEAPVITLHPDHSTRAILSYLIHCCRNHPKYDLDLLYPEWMVG
ncbi:MAG: hypothetical protein Q8918_09455 [Bacteroidota bacterium]|nr:hypothetical protein [Bacteroidota bacterium]MDP4214252.1 hypothetical protein [Bacteroidota bacterium]MDP4250317.1 hypothetical protein [Bacteroidota bacterium]